MTEAKQIRIMLELFEEMQRSNEKHVDVLGAWGGGRASAFKLAADHCRNVLLYVFDENLYAPDETNEGDA